MNVCMLMYRTMPQTQRRVIVANSVGRRYDYVDILCIGQKSQERYEHQNNIAYYRLPPYIRTDGPGGAHDRFPKQMLQYSTYILASFIKLVSLSIHKKYDVIHVHNPPDFIILAAIPFKLLLGTKIILDLHDMLPEVLTSHLNLPDNHLFAKSAKIVEKYAIRYSDAVICTNEYDKEIVLSRNSIDPDKIFVVMNSPDLNLCMSEKSTKDQFGLGGKFVLLFEGTIWNRRGIQTIIESICTLKDKVPLTLLVVGDGPDLEDLKNLSSRLGVSDYVKFTGWVDQKLLSEYISVSDVCIIPFFRTKVNERGVPNKLFEYIVHDKPVLSSNLKGISSTFSDQEITFFEPGDANDLADKILWCYHNPEQLEAKIVAAKKRYYAEYTWPKMEKELYRCYDSLSGST